VTKDEFRKLIERALADRRGRALLGDARGLRRELAKHIADKTWPEIRRPNAPPRRKPTE
jgi:hypothetical protein